MKSPSELRRIAEGATPGNWKGDPVAGEIVVGESATECGEVIATSYTSMDTQHIATFDPPTILALLARLERYEEALRLALPLLRIPDNGHHYCRYCDAHSPEWSHAASCFFVGYSAEVDAARAMARAALEEK